MVLIIDQTAVGAASPTTINADMTPSSPGVGGTVGVANAAGWPNNVGRFPAVIDRDTPNEEKVLFSNSSGSTFTVAQRGYDGTTAKNHTAGATIEFILPAAVILQIIQHVDDLETSPHSAKLPVGTVAAHDTTTRHAYGAAFGTPGAPTVIQPDASAAAGSGARPAREDHTHGIVAAAASTITNANAEGASTSFARADHNHAYGALSVDSATLAANAVIAGKIADGAVNTTAKISDAIVTLAKIASEAGTNYSPTFTNVSLGTGPTTWGRSFKIGRLVFGIAGFILGTGGNVTGTIQASIPYVPFKAGGVTASDTGWVTAGRARDVSTAATFSGLGLVVTDSSGQVQNFATAGASASWDATTPFNWTTGDTLSILFVYESTS